MTPVNFDFDALDKAINEAPVAGFGPRSAFGKCTMSIDIVSWKDRVIQTRPFVKGTTADKSKGEYLQITFHIDVTELNPILTNEWKRKVDIKQSGAKAPTDWSEIVEPSLKKVFGKEWHKAIGKGVYVEVEELETVVTTKDGSKKGWDRVDETTGETKHYTNTAPSFVRSFKSKADCVAAYTEKYKKADDMSFGSDSGFTAKDINDVKGLIGAIEDKTQLLDILTNNPPFSQYDLVELLTAAGADAELLALAAE
jgi:hypothetical protein